MATEESTRLFIAETAEAVASIVLADLRRAPQPDYLTPADVATMLKTSPETVLRWIRKCELRASNLNKPGTRPRWIIERSAVSEFLKKREPQPPQKRTRRKQDAGVIEYF